jgi:hypothetical protein
MIIRCRRWLARLLMPRTPEHRGLVPYGPYETAWKEALAETHARVRALEARVTVLEAALEDEGTSKAMANWTAPDMDAHLGAN